MQKKIAGLMLALAVLASGAVAQDDAASRDWAKALEIKSLLLEKGKEKAVPITVTMDRTTAILTGEVESEVVLELAKEVALSVPGVKKVDNRLRLAAGGKATGTEQELEDARIESAVKLALFKEIGTRASKLEIESVQGVVSVRGKVPDAARKTVALETVKKGVGVKVVVDLLTID